MTKPKKTFFKTMELLSSTKAIVGLLAFFLGIAFSLGVYLTRIDNRVYAVESVQKEILLDHKTIEQRFDNIENNYFRLFGQFGLEYEKFNK